MRPNTEVWIERMIPQCWGIPWMHCRQNLWKRAATDILALRKQYNYASATYTEFRNKIQCTLVSWLLTTKTDEYLTKGQRGEIAEIHIKATSTLQNVSRKPSGYDKHICTVRCKATNWVTQQHDVISAEKSYTSMKIGRMVNWFAHYWRHQYCWLYRIK
jgi:hypothetical protein